MNSLIRHIANNATQSQNAMVRIATAAVAVSIAVVIISLAVIFGFKEQIQTLVSESVADVTIAQPFSQKRAEHHPISDDKALFDLIASTENVAHTERYALRGCVIRGSKGAAGIVLKGIGAEAKTSFLAERLNEGAMPKIEEARRKEILLSQSIAEKIGAETDSRVEILLLAGDTPRREVFKVCGTYLSALGDTGAELCTRVAQRREVCSAHLEHLAAWRVTRQKKNFDATVCLGSNLLGDALREEYLLASCLLDFRHRSLIQALCQKRCLRLGTNAFEHNSCRTLATANYASSQGIALGVSHVFGRGDKVEQRLVVADRVVLSPLLRERLRNCNIGHTLRNECLNLLLESENHRQTYNHHRDTHRYGRCGNAHHRILRLRGIVGDMSD